MVKKCVCGMILPTPCPDCPPQVVRCPRCGREVLLEPMRDPDDVAEAQDMLRRRGLK